MYASKSATTGIAVNITPPPKKKKKKKKLILLFPWVYWRDTCVTQNPYLHRNIRLIKVLPFAVLGSNLIGVNDIVWVLNFTLFLINISKIDTVLIYTLYLFFPGHGPIQTDKNYIWN